MGVNATWPLINKTSPCVPFFGAVVEHLEDTFDIRHSSKHTVPKAEVDICALMSMFGLEGGSIFHYKAGRKYTVTKKATPKDAFSEGVHSLLDTQWLTDWFGERMVYLKYTSTLQDYTNPSDATMPA
jgi:hypothetical protein